MGRGGGRAGSRHRSRRMGGGGGLAGGRSRACAGRWGGGHAGGRRWTGGGACSRVGAATARVAGARAFPALVAGPSRRRGRREEQARSRKDISHAFADYVPACYTTWSATSAKVIKMKDPRNKNTKYISVILIVIIERVTYNGKDVKTPLTGRRTPPHAVFYSSALGFLTAHADAERASSPLLSPR